MRQPPPDTCTHRDVTTTHARHSGAVSAVQIQTSSSLPSDTPARHASRLRRCDGPASGEQGPRP
eukprot:12410411-Alexandrium_andersonii.AAC.1